MPRLTVSTSVEKKTVSRLQEQSRKSVVKKKGAKTSRRSVIPRSKKNVAVRMAPDGIPWPPLPEIFGHVNMKAAQIREAVLSAMAKVRDATGEEQAEGKSKQRRRKVTQK